MSGAEVVGLLSAIIGIIDASVKVYDAFKSATGVPSSFHDVALRLPLAQDTLQMAWEGLDEFENDRSLRMMASCLQSCQQKATKLQGIFEGLAISEDRPRVVRLVNAWRATRKAGKVQTLSQGISDDLQALTANHAIRAATRSQMKELVDKMEARQQSTGRPHVSLHNDGSGRIISHSGVGDQNISGGPQYKGVFQGSFNFNTS